MMTSEIRDLFKDPTDLWTFLFENVRDAAFIADADTGIILDANKQAEILLELPRSEIIGMHQSQLHPPEKAVTYRRFFERDQKDVQPTPKIGYVITSSGKKIPVEILANIYKLDNKTFQLGLFRNISSRRHAETALQASESKYRSLVQQSSNGIMLVDDQGFVVEWNEALEQITGLAGKEAIGKTLWEVQYQLAPEAFKRRNSPEHMEKVIKEFIASGQGRTETQYSIIKVQKGNTVECILHQITFPVLIRRRRFTCAILRDITEQKQVEDALRESEDKYRTLFESANVGIIITDIEGNILETNKAVADLTGYSLSKILKMQTPEFHAEPAETEKLKKLIRKRGKVTNQEVRFKKKNGDQFWVSLNVQVIRYKGNPALLITIIDIDEIMRARDALKDAYEDALELSQLKSNLITFVSHELKTPLVPIMGWADLIINALNKGKRIDNIIGREEIASIFNAAKRLEHIIDEYLDLGRLEGKRLVLNKKTLNLVKLLAEALKNVEMLARASNITIHVNVEDVILDVDGFRIEQVFINILSNAIKYSPPDKEIWVTTIKDDSSLKIFFTDQGCGFTMEELKGIWRPFANLASRRKKGMPTGTGIGLYLSKGLVEMHGGTIEIFSDGADKGSRVEISLPLKTQAEKEFALKESLAKN